MRTLGFRTHVLLALAAAAGVVAALARPWYAPAASTPAAGDLDGPLYTLTDTVNRWIGDTAGTTGWDALGVWGTALAGFAALTGAGAFGCLVPALQGVAREALRYGSLGCLGIAAWKLLDSPGPNAALEPRHGVFVAALAAAIAVVSGSAVASAPLRSSR
jgi:hypothetical protein